MSYFCITLIAVSTILKKVQSKLTKSTVRFFNPTISLTACEKKNYETTKKNKKNWDFDKKLLLISSESTSTLKTTQNVQILRHLGVAYWESFRVSDLACAHRVGVEVEEVFPLCVRTAAAAYFEKIFFRKKMKILIGVERRPVQKLHIQYTEKIVCEREPKKIFSCMRMLLCWGNNKSKNKQKIVNFYEFFFPFLFSFFFLSLIVVVVVARHPTFWKKCSVECLYCLGL